MKQITLVTFLLDRTGSMSRIKDDTIGGFNAYLEGLQQEKDAEIAFTLLQFDSLSVDKMYVAQPIADIRPLDNLSFMPRASTPLIDAAYKTIKAVEVALTARDDKPKVVVCIMTDGHENASTEHTWAELNAIIKEKTAAGWQFNFMGASIDAYDQAAKMGISAHATMSYDSRDPRATQAAFTSSARNSSDFSAGRAKTTNYSDAQRKDAGDQFFKPDPAPQPGARVPVAQPAAAPQPAVHHVAVDDITL